MEMKFKQIYRVKGEDVLKKYLDGKELSDAIKNILPHVEAGKKVYMHMGGSEHNYNVLKDALKKDTNFFNSNAKSEVERSIAEYDSYFETYGSYDMVIYDIV